MYGLLQTVTNSLRIALYLDTVMEENDVTNAPRNIGDDKDGPGKVVYLTFEFASDDEVLRIPVKATGSAAIVNPLVDKAFAFAIAGEYVALCGGNLTRGATFIGLQAHLKKTYSHVLFSKFVIPGRSLDVECITHPHQSYYLGYHPVTLATELIRSDRKDIVVEFDGRCTGGVIIEDLIRYICDTAITQYDNIANEPSVDIKSQPPSDAK